MQFGLETVGPHLLPRYRNDERSFAAAAEPLFRHGLREPVPRNEKSQRTALASILVFLCEDYELVLATA